MANLSFLSILFCISLPGGSSLSLPCVHKEGLHFVGSHESELIVSCSSAHRCQLARKTLRYPHRESLPGCRNTSIIQCRDSENSVSASYSQVTMICFWPSAQNIDDSKQSDGQKTTPANKLLLFGFPRLVLYREHFCCRPRERLDLVYVKQTNKCRNKAVVANKGVKARRSRQGKRTNRAKAIAYRQMETALRRD